MWQHKVEEQENILVLPSFLFLFSYMLKSILNLKPSHKRIVFFVWIPTFQLSIVKKSFCELLSACIMVDYDKMHHEMVTSCLLGSRQFKVFNLGSNKEKLYNQGVKRLLPLPQPEKNRNKKTT